MNCTICINEGSNVKGMYNDCVIECLEKIKTHYIRLKRQISDNESFITTLKETNNKLQRTINSYEQAEKKSEKKRRRAFAEEQKVGCELECSDIFDNAVGDKSTADLNMALNDENEFEISFIPSTPASKDKPVVKREPMKVISSPKNPSAMNTIKDVTSKKLKNNESGEENKKAGGWNSKENEIKKSFIRPYKNSDRIARHVKREYKSGNLSLKPGRLRQTRLQLSISKNTSNTGDTTFFEESINASPNAETSLKKISPLRNIDYKIEDGDNERISENSGLESCARNLKCEKSPLSEANEKTLDSSSVVLLTPASQDVIFLDDSSESFNIESMDLLRDLMNPTESHLSNLRRMESNRIKLLQKTVSDKIENQVNKYPDVENKQESFYKTEDVSIKSNKVEKDNLNISPIKVSKEENHERVKGQRLFNVDCNECQTYIKYLGTHLSDEEIKQHIRNCTKHKKRIELNLTPDGFWDPLIKPLDKDDPRNEILIDTRFIGKERRN